MELMRMPGGYDAALSCFLPAQDPGPPGFLFLGLRRPQLRDDKPLIHRGPHITPDS